MRETAGTHTKWFLSTINSKKINKKTERCSMLWFLILPRTRFNYGCGSLHTEARYNSKCSLLAAQLHTPEQSNTAPGVSQVNLVEHHTRVGVQCAWATEEYF